MPTIAVRDCDLYYESHGSGEAVLLVPGLGGVGAFWTRQIPALAPHFRVITHDHRGAGQSSHSDIRYSVDQMAQDTLDLMDALGLDRVHYVGHSTGGAIGQTIATQHPQRLASLVLSATWPKADEAFRSAFTERKRVLLEEGAAAYQALSRPYLYPADMLATESAAIAAAEEAARAAYPPARVLASRIDAIVAFDRSEKLGAIDLPTLVICARDDGLTPPHFSEALARAIPGARLTFLEKGAHFCPLTASDAYNAVLTDFLRAQTARN